MESGNFRRDSESPLSRDDGSVRVTEGGAQDQGYEYGSASGREYSNWGRPIRGYGYQQRPRYPTETRPSFLTSEFVGTILAIVALGITAGVMDIVNARLTWILTAAMVVGYVVSRGLAKAGTESRSIDPREQLLRQGQGGAPQQQHQAAQQQPRYAAGSWSGMQRAGYGRGAGNPLETRPFFLTSEFVGTLLAIIALACTAAAMPNLGARLTWILIAAMVFTYSLSRGVAKAGTHSHSLDPRERLLGGGGDFTEQETESGGGPAYGGTRPIETKPFFVTSEFIGTLLAIVAIAISAAALDILNVRLTWILITAMVCGYVLSRGLAKIGVKSHSLDPREQVLQRVADGGQQGRQPVGGR